MTDNGDGLRRTRPAEGSALVAAVNDLLDAIAEAGLEMHSFMLYQHGSVVAEGWWKPYRPDRVHMMHSAAKSFTASGIGIAVDEGRLSLDDRVTSFFPDRLPERVSGHLEAMTVRHLLTMSTGHETGISGGEWRYIRSSWIEEFFKEPVAEAPGERFTYSSASSYILSAILQKATGQRMHEYMETRFFQPLGIRGVRWDVGPDDVNTGGNGLSCTTADLLKLGILHLNGGEWNGKRVLSSHWVREATRPHLKNIVRGAFSGKRYFTETGGVNARSPAAIRTGYGLHWWIDPHGAFSARGLFGQYCFVFPQQDAVLATTAGLPLADARLGDLIWTRLFPGLCSESLGADVGGLEARVAALELPRDPAGVSPPLQLPREFVAEPNEDGIERLRFALSGDRVVFTLIDASGEHSIAAGLGFWIESNTTMMATTTAAKLHHGYQLPSARVVAGATWRDAGALVMTWMFVETPFRDTLVCRFDGRTLFLDHSVNANAEDTERPTIVARA